MSENRRNGTKAYPEEDWWLLYDSLLKKESDPEKTVHTESIRHIRNSGKHSGLSGLDGVYQSWNAYLYGLSLDSYVDHELTVWVRDTELIHVQKDEGQNTLYRNVWILDGDNQRPYGIYRRYSAKNPALQEL